MLKKISLKKSGVNRIKSNHSELKADDVEDFLKSFHPGEWVILSSPEGQWLGYVNPLLEFTANPITVLEPLTNPKITPTDYIKRKLDTAYALRGKIKDYLSGCRLVYGQQDALPGLQIDLFENACFIQINTAGLDTHRDFIKTYVFELTQKKCYFLDNQKYREKESLPFFEAEKLPDIKVFENDLHLSVRSEVIQKVGYYYDHRENRRALTDLILRMDHSFKNGIDLFCYIGSWGLHALKANVAQMTFVDQGDFSAEIQNNLKLNKFDDRGQYVRADVFKYLDQCAQEGKTFDLILSDPPAFAKSLSQKKGALEGYHKLHRKVLKLAAPWSLVGFSSCTHYVDQDEFQKTILEEAQKENRKVHLIYQGLQGWDHPIKSTMDKSNYIKSFFYIVE